ncbi:hypothetical protein LZ32DRAFT_653090 [Colletotrichum eremochloae]|nr:hypothetical protein LZ32DRAFT_653090 [Colletotrichum eremochloae]
MSGLRLEGRGGLRPYLSWPWGGWHGNSMWRLPMISGTLLNFHEWLACHKWVACEDGDDNRPAVSTSRVQRSECLYFCTWTAFFQISRQSRTGPPFASKLESGLHRFGLLNAKGDWFWDDHHAVARRDRLPKIYRRAFDLASFEAGKAWREGTLG